MMLVYHYVIIPFHPQYLPRHAPLILQGGGCQRGGCRWPETLHFPLLSSQKTTIEFHSHLLLAPSKALSDKDFSITLNKSKVSHCKLFLRNISPFCRTPYHFYKRFVRIAHDVFLPGFLKEFALHIILVPCCNSPACC